MRSGGGGRRARRFLRVLSLTAAVLAGSADAAGAVPVVTEPGPLPLPPVVRGGSQTTPPVSGAEATPPTTAPPATVVVPPTGMPAGPPGESSRVGAPARSEGARSTSSDKPATSSTAPAHVPVVSPAVSPAAADEQPAVSRLRHATVPAARHFKFPLGLAALVLGFLAVQSRLDRRDPKLAMAPVSIDDDLLHFT